jgi:hypothetical protein
MDIEVGRELERVRGDRANLSNVSVAHGMQPAQREPIRVD